MLDLKFIRENLNRIIENTKNRQVAANPERVVALYDRRNQLLQESEGLRHRRNLNAQEMKQKPEADRRQQLIEEGKALKERISDTERMLEQLSAELNEELVKIPNLSHPDAPLGKGDEDNRELKRWGEPPRFSFQAKDHVELARELDLVDFETAARVSGPKFYYLKNAAVYLELGLIRYALDILQKQDFVVTLTPDIAKEQVVEGIGFNPRGEESNIYSVEGTDACLVGTAEITLGGYYAGQILDGQTLPVKMAGVSHCFRREAGAAGQYSKGLYRVHQFSKVEMFIFCKPQDSDAMHSYLLDLEEKIFQGLEIPYRVVDTCTGELGGPAYRKFDVEAWMPGRGDNGDWGEVTSASNCTDYQARRLAIRFKEDGQNRYVHMLNGTAVAVSRAIIAILENHQQANGSVRIPAALVPYTGFDRIAAK